MKTTPWTIEGAFGSRARFSSDVDCSLKHEVQFVRMDNQIP